MIKAVIFDLDNTLYDYDKLNICALDSTYKWFSKLTTTTEDEFKQAFYLAREEIKSHMGSCAAQHNRLLYFQRTCEKLRLNPIKYSLDLYEEYWNYMLNNMVLSYGILDLFKKLKNNNIKIGICTDLTSHIQHRKIKKLGIADFIDVFVSSEEAGVEKPDLHIFNMTLDKLKVKPKETIFVGDSYNKDILGAYNVGMFPVWYNPYGITCDKGTLQEILTIENFTQLERFIYNEK